MILSIDHSAILFNCCAKTNKSVFPPIKVKLYHKTIWDSIATSLSNQLAILHDHISNPISIDNLDPINRSKNIAANFLTNTITVIHNHIAEKTSNQTQAFHAAFNHL